MDITLKRLNRMSDFIFGSAMTILILLFKLPTADQVSNPALFDLYLDDSLPRLFIFVVTFAVLAIYWVKDLGQFKYIEKTNNTHIWLQLGSLAFIILLPWVNSLLEIIPNNTDVRIIYCLDIFFIGFFSSAAWYYASRQNRLISKDLSLKTIKEITSSNITEPIISIIAIIVALVKPEWFDLTFILIPLLFMAQKKISEKLKPAS